MRPRLEPEFPIYGIEKHGSDETAIAGIADAMAHSATGAPEVVIDWKSDVNPSAATLDRYRAQVRTYLEVSGAAAGLIVFMSSGQVVPVSLE